MDAPRPFDLASTVTSHGFYEVPPFSWDPDRRRLDIALRPPVMRVSVTQQSARRPVIGIRVRSRSRSAPRGLRERVKARVAHVLDFGRDLAAFYRVCRTYEPLAWVPRARAGRILRCPDLFTDVVVSICGTNTQWKQAVRSVRLLSEIGPRAAGTDLRCFPTPAEVLEAGAGFLVDHARVGYRHRTILELCRKVLGKEIDLTLDPSLSGDGMRELFASLPGIGPVTARYLACLHGRTDELAVDSFVLRYIGDKYHAGMKPTVAQVQRRYAGFGEQRALVYWFELLGDVDPVTWKVRKSQ
jgi:N-glycosylase/DNA lyase